MTMKLLVIYVGMKIKPFTCLQKGKHGHMPQKVWTSSLTCSQQVQSTIWMLAEDAHLTCSAGAGHYKVVYRDVGSATKHSASSRHKDGINIGPPNHCIQPVDTFG